MSYSTIILASILTALVIYLIVMVGVMSAETGTYNKVKDERTALNDANAALVKSVKSKFAIA